jgi:hypothetical protein
MQNVKPALLERIRYLGYHILYFNRLILFYNLFFALFGAVHENKFSHSRLTGAIMLPSTDHMIQQYGAECLGTCGNFKLRVVLDNPEKINLSSSSPNGARVLRTRISRGSTYA